MMIVKTITKQRKEGGRDDHQALCISASEGVIYVTKGCLDVQKGSVNELSKAFDFVSSLGRAGADDGLISGLSRRH